MKKQLYALIVCATMFSSTACTSATPNPSPEITTSLDSAIASFESDVSEDCYKDVIDTVNNFCSSETIELFKDIYKDYGKPNYDSDTVIEQTDKFDFDMKSGFTDIYLKYSDNNDLEFVLFGYNYSVLWIMNQNLAAMSSDISYNEELDEYYKLMTEQPSTESADDFCLYVTKNNLFDYVTILKKISENDIAELIDIDLDTCETLFEACAYYIETEEPTSLYDTYVKTTNFLISIIDTLEEHPEYKQSFTSYDTQNMRRTIDSSISSCRKMCDSYSKNSRWVIDDVNKYGDYIDTITEFLIELIKNVNTILEK